MVSPGLSIGLLTASISSISILALVFLRVIRICEEMKSNGDWANQPWRVPEYKLAKFLQWAIYAGGFAGISSLLSIYVSLQIHPTTQFEIDTTLVFVSGLLVFAEIIAIIAGIKYFEIEIL